jgi:hypothetical protein
VGGTISDSLVGKARRSLGLARKRAGRKAKAAGETPGAQAPTVVRQDGRKTTTSGRGTVGAGEMPGVASRRPSSAAKGLASDRDRMLIALERDLNRLLLGLLEMEGLTEVEEHIRAARRVVSREIR